MTKKTPGATALTKFLEENTLEDGSRITNEAFGALVSATGSYISMLKSGKCAPSRRLALRIEVVTNKAVPASIWEVDIDPMSTSRAAVAEAH